MISIKFSIRYPYLSVSQDGDIVMNDVIALNNPDKQVIELTQSVALNNIYDGKLFGINMPAGGLITLPKAVGSGAEYRFTVYEHIVSSFVQFSPFSGDTLTGLELLLIDEDAESIFPVVADIGAVDYIRLNGDTTGGHPGDYLEFKDIAPGVMRYKSRLHTFRPA